LGEEDKSTGQENKKKKGKKHQSTCEYEKERREGRKMKKDK
jgi:hypothetical protein